MIDTESKREYSKEEIALMEQLLNHFVEAVRYVPNRSNKLNQIYFKAKEFLNKKK